MQKPDPECEPLEQIDCTKYQRLTHRMEKKLAVYKLCSETFVSKQPVPYIKAPDEESDASSVKQKRQSDTSLQRPSNKLRRMILKDNDLVSSIYGRQIIKEDTMQDISKWVKAEDDQNGTLAVSDSEACKKIRAFHD